MSGSAAPKQPIATEDLERSPQAEAGIPYHQTAIVRSSVPVCSNRTGGVSDELGVAGARQPILEQPIIKTEHVGRRGL